MKIGIVGQGYVGLPLSMAFASSGVETIGIEISPEIILNLSRGVSHIVDVSSEKLEQVIHEGKYSITDDYTVVQECDAIIICVPTPLTHDRLPDVSLLKSAITEIAPFLGSSSLLVSESTSFPGTLRHLISPIIKELNPNYDSIMLATAPERVDPGNRKWNQANTPRLIGGLSEKATKSAVEIYSRICENIVEVSSPEVAESAKLLENSFRLINIAFINEFAQAMDGLGISAHEVIAAAASKPYGFMPFYPGLGAGGHCIPVDPVYLSSILETKSIGHPLLKHAIKENQKSYKFVVNKINESEKKIRSILLIGMSYKPGISDLRESPALELFHDLLEDYEVSFYDENFDSIGSHKRVEDLKGFDLVLIVNLIDEIHYKILKMENDLVLNCTGVSLSHLGISSIFDGNSPLV